MDPNEDQSAVEAEVETTLSPSETDGVSSSDTVDDAPDSSADAIRKEFLEKYGDDEPEEPGEPEGEDQSEPVEAAADAQDPEQEETSVDADDQDDDKFRIPDEQFKGLPDGVKQRLGHLNARAKKAERELAARDDEIVPLKDSHERFTTLQTFVHDNGIEPQNVTLAFDAMARLSKGDFQGFIDAVQPWYQQAMQAIGKEVPADLQQRIEDGYLSEEDAREMAKMRVQSHVYKGQAEQARQRQEQSDAQVAQERQSQGIIAAVNDREAQLKSSDPDYAQKSQAIRSMIKMVMDKGGVPKTPSDAIALINEAHETVTSNFSRPAAPKPTPPRPTASQSPRGNPEPGNAREAIMQGLMDFRV